MTYDCCCRMWPYRLFFLSDLGKHKQFERHQCTVMVVEQLKEEHTVLLPNPQ